MTDGTQPRRERSDPFSVSATTVFLFWYISVLASLTVVTHAAQVLSLKFNTYATLSLFITLAASGLILYTSAKSLRASFPMDGRNLLWIFLLGLAGAWLALSFHRLGRISPDEYYYAANPVYYLQHPFEAMGFEVRTFYTGTNHVFSVSLVTAGAYEYIQALVAHLLNASFATTYYVLFGGITGFLIPVSMFLFIHRLCHDVMGSILGAFIATCAIALMGDTLWAPAAYSFLRAFEGKSFLLFAGIPLFAVASWSFFSKQSWLTWLQVTALAIALVGMSTTSLAVLPILGAILFVSYWIAEGRDGFMPRSILRIGLLYCAAFTYLIGFAFIAARTDDLRNALYLNSAYPTSFDGYAEGFIFRPLPVTLVSSILFLAACLVFVKGKSRTMLAAWMALLTLFVLNPIAARLWLGYFQGVYFRFFYIFPFQAAAGILAAALYAGSPRLIMHKRVLLWTGVCAIMILLNFAISTSLLRNPNYSRGGWLEDTDLRRAEAISVAIPRGVMISPFPLSGAVSMIDSRYPQMITRNDIMLLYLNQEGRASDAALRVNAEAFLSGNSDDPTPLITLVDNYPEIQSIVFYRKMADQQNAESLSAILTARGFAERTRILDLIVYSRTHG